MSGTRAPLAALVPAGGRARRFGSDKTLATVEGATIVARAVAACRDSGASPVVAIGPAENAPPGALTVREEPPFGGPVAALAAGLPLVADAELIAVVAGDMPFAAGALDVLVAALDDTTPADGAWAVDESGRSQPLLAVYRAASLRVALQRLREPAGASLRALTADLHMIEVRVGASAIDIDTPEALARVGGEKP